LASGKGKENHLGGVVVITIAPKAATSSPVGSVPKAVPEKVLGKGKGVHEGGKGGRGR